MKKLFNKSTSDNGNSWMSYTDLMSGFLIVFIIASLIAYKGYVIASASKGELINKVASLEKENERLKEQLSVALDKVTDLEEKLNALTVQKEDYDKIVQFLEAQRNLNSQYFTYNEKYQRFECKLDVQFEPNKYDIPSGDKEHLKSAGKELLSIIKKYKTDNIAFKVVIDGRAAKNLDKDLDKKYFGSVQELSYNRARALYNLWKDAGIVNSIENTESEIFISGLGFGGINRYSGLSEYKNKTFIIQVIPFLKYKDK